MTLVSPEDDLSPAPLTSARADGVRAAGPSSPMPTMDSQRADAALSCASRSAVAMRRILVLGGTTEARTLVRALATRGKLAVMLCLPGAPRSLLRKVCRCAPEALAEQPGSRST